MKYQDVWIVFKSPLTKEQEEIMISGFKSIVEGLRGRLIETKKRCDTPILRSSVSSSAIKNMCDILYENLYSYIRLEKENEKKYVFRVAEGAFANMDVKIWKFKFLMWKKVQRRFIDFFKKKICPEMGVLPEDVEIVFIT